jgi:hypothetical protein
MRPILHAIGDPQSRPILGVVLVHKYSITLTLILLTHILLVALENTDIVIFAPLILLILYVSGFMLMADRSRFSAVIVSLGLVAMVLAGVHIAVGGKTLLVLSLCCHSFFLVLLIVFILKRLFKSKTMPLDNIMAGVIVFLFMAGVWAQFYALLLLANPLALSVPGGSLGAHPYITLYYFSITTLTTAGLGDVTPVSDMARIVTAYESLLGQVYLVVFIALLMGRHFANR